MRLDELRARLMQSGANPFHRTLILRAWALGRALDAARPRPEDYLPASVRAALPEFAQTLDRLARVTSEHRGADGATRLLVTLHDGETVESVLLPRRGLCVSSQVGCAVGCRFCMTGIGGLVRQLGSAEIVAQVVIARRRQVVRKVVFMGMGEPAHNLDNVLDAIQFLGTTVSIGHKNLVLSTVGDRRLFDRLEALGPGDVHPALAVSLHTTDPALRAQLLPRAPAIEIGELIERATAYAAATGYPIQYQWTLLAGVNDTHDEIERVATLLAGRYAVLNLIPYNAVDGLDYARPSWEHAAHIARTLHRRGLLTKLRHSAGQDVDGGCGQLRRRFEATSSAA